MIQGDYQSRFGFSNIFLHKVLLFICMKGERMVFYMGAINNAFGCVKILENVTIRIMNKIFPKTRIAIDGGIYIGRMALRPNIP